MRLLAMWATTSPAAARPHQPAEKPGSPQARRPAMVTEVRVMGSTAALVSTSHRVMGSTAPGGGLPVRSTARPRAPRDVPGPVAAGGRAASATVPSVPTMWCARRRRLCGGQQPHLLPGLVVGVGGAHLLLELLELGGVGEWQQRQQLGHVAGHLHLPPHEGGGCFALAL